MSEKELGRVEILSRVAAGEWKVVDAAELMGLCYRQTKRLWGRYRQGGAQALQHGNTGRPSNRAKPRKFRERVLRLVRSKYGGEVGERFGPTLAAEHLESDDGVPVDSETLRRWMLAEGLWSRERKRKQHRRMGTHHPRDISNELRVGTFLKSFDTNPGFCLTNQFPPHRI